MAAKGSPIADGAFLHFGFTRLRLNGSGWLRQTFFSLDDVKSNVLVPINMSTLTNIEPTKLANFTQQRAYLEVKTTAINEVFTISKITIFIKPVAGSIPQ